MIVLDASAAIAFVLNLSPRAWVVERLLGAEGLAAPHCIDTEVVSALRRRAQRGLLEPEEGAAALGDFLDLGLDRHSEAALLFRMWELRHNLSAFDAAYVALAEALRAELVTIDAALARAPGHAARVTAYPG